MVFDEAGDEHGERRSDARLTGPSADQTPQLTHPLAGRLSVTSHFRKSGEVLVGHREREGGAQNGEPD